MKYYYILLDIMNKGDIMDINQKIIYQLAEKYNCTVEDEYKEGTDNVCTITAEFESDDGTNLFFEVMEYNNVHSMLQTSFNDENGLYDYISFKYR